MTDIMTTHDVNRAIYVALVNALHAVDPLFREGMRWCMNPDWLAVTKAVTDPSGEPYWRDGATHLLGIPFEVTDDGGAPHLARRG